MEPFFLVVQKTAAFLIGNTSHRELITPMLHSLQWFQWKYCVKFKILVFSFEDPYGTIPSCLITLYDPNLPQQLCSTETMELSASRVKLVLGGERGFSVTGLQI